MELTFLVFLRTKWIGMKPYRADNKGTLFFSRGSVNFYFLCINRVAFVVVLTGREIRAGEALRRREKRQVEGAGEGFNIPGPLYPRCATHRCSYVLPPPLRHPPLKTLPPHLLLTIRQLECLAAYRIRQRPSHLMVV